MAFSIEALRRDHTEGKEVELPGGLVVRMRPVSTATFLAAGRIPDSLSPVVARLLTSGNPAAAVANIDDIKAMLGMQRAFALTCIISPVVVEGEPGPEEISIEWLSDEDLSFIYNFIGQPAAALARFHPGWRDEAHAVESVRDSEGGATAAE